jgi:hypothetical protein
MAVQVVQEKNNGLFGGLGTLLSLGGTLMGIPMMGTIGMGMNAVDALASGNPAGAAMSTMGMKNPTGGGGNWINPAEGNLYSPGGTATRMLWEPAAQRARTQMGF